MAQVKIYGRREALHLKRDIISHAIHDAIVRAFSYPVDKRFHRFMALEESEFIHPADRSERYIILEISIFEGRSMTAKKALIHYLFENFLTMVDVEAIDLEITIFEKPRSNWGIRGLPADELDLDYKVTV